MFEGIGIRFNKHIEGDGRTVSAHAGLSAFLYSKTVCPL
jgi:hypothetical protein